MTRSARLGRVRVSSLDFARELRLYAVHGRRLEPHGAMFVTQMRAADWSSYLDPTGAPSAVTT